MTIVFAILSIALSVGAQFLLKFGVQETGFDNQQNIMLIIKNWKILSGYLCYSLAAIIWLKVLADWDVSKAYPLMGIGFILSLILGWMLGEVISMVRLLGILAISFGVLLVART